MLQLYFLGLSCLCLTLAWVVPVFSLFVSCLSCLCFSFVWFLAELSLSLLIILVSFVWLLAELSGESCELLWVACSALIFPGQSRPRTLQTLREYEERKNIFFSGISWKGAGGCRPFASTLGVTKYQCPNFSVLFSPSHKLFVSPKCHSASLCNTWKMEMQPFAISGHEMNLQLLGLLRLVGLLILWKETQITIRDGLEQKNWNWNGPIWKRNGRSCEKRSNMIKVMMGWDRRKKAFFAEVRI